VVLPSGDGGQKVAWVGPFFGPTKA